MANGDISVTIGVKGETKFKTALTECQNVLKQLDSGLKANAAEYEANADALGENAERTRLLEESLRVQKKIVKDLGAAIEYANKEYGEASTQTTKYVTAQNKAREAIAKLEKELKDTDREMEELGRDSKKVGRQIENGIGDAAEDAAKSLDDMYNGLKGEMEAIAGMMGMGIVADVASGIADAATGVYDFVEETREYRRQMSFAEQNARNAGLEWEEVETVLFRIAAITGDMDGAYEAMSNLMNAGLDAAELANAADLLTAAAIKWPETINVESLAESLQETIATKSAVGQYAELLERMGIDLETVNKALEQTTDAEAAQEVALSMIANRGLEQQLAEYELLNEMMIKSQEASLQLEAAWAKLGGTIEYWVTPIVNAITATVVAINDLLSGRAFERKREENAGVMSVIEEETGYYSELEEINRKIAELDSQGRYMEAEQLGKRRSELIGLIAEAATALTEAEEAGKQAGEALTEGTETAVEDGGEKIEQATETTMEGMADAVETSGQAAIDNTVQMVSEMQSAVDSFSTQNIIDQYDRIDGLGGRDTTWRSGGLGGGPVSGGGAMEMTQKAMISFNVNGRRFANAIINDINAAQGRTVELA